MVGAGMIAILSGAKSGRLGVPGNESQHCEDFAHHLFIIIVVLGGGTA
jgi:hypothetical protein